MRKVKGTFCEYCIMRPMVHHIEKYNSENRGGCRHSQRSRLRISDVPLLQYPSYTRTSIELHLELLRLSID